MGLSSRWVGEACGPENMGSGFVYPRRVSAQRQLSRAQGGTGSNDAAGESGHIDSKEDKDSPGQQSRQNWQTKRTRTRWRSGEVRGERVGGLRLDDAPGVVQLPRQDSALWVNRGTGAEVNTTTHSCAVIRAELDAGQCWRWVEGRLLIGRSPGAEVCFHRCEY